MKSSSLFLTLLLLFSALPVALRAQYDPDDPNVNAGLKNSEKYKADHEPFANVLKLHPFGFVGSHLMLGYERALNDKWTLNLNAAYGLSENNNYYRVGNMEAFYAELQARYYLSGIASKVYVAPYALFKTMSFGYSDDYWYGGNAPTNEQFRASAFGVGVLLGYHFRLAGPLTLDGYLGGGLLRADAPDFDDPNQGQYYYNDYNEPRLDQVAIDRYHTGVALQIGLALGIDLK